ncbi:MAG: DUF1844 domain-containing protein [Acidobacteria bacterium]|nr:DUF1844 domain-containing protein [Acidobacteriota bacterium]
MGEEKKPSFRVSDRRLFNSDGTPREVQEAPESEVGATQTTSISTDAPTQSITPPVPSTARSTVSPGFDEIEPVEDPRFSDFILSLAGQAMMCLGMVNPGYGPVEVDLGTAHHLIQVLDMLTIKTRNNLAREESQVLNEVLHNLKDRFAAMTGEPLQ